MPQDVIADESRPIDLLGQNQSATRAWQIRLAIQKQQHPLAQKHAASLERARHAAADVVGRCRDNGPAQAGDIYRGGSEAGKKQQPRPLHRNTYDDGRVSTMKKAQPTGCALVLEGSLSQLLSRSKRCNLARCCASALVSAKRLGSTWLEKRQVQAITAIWPDLLPQRAFRHAVRLHTTRGSGPFSSTASQPDIPGSGFQRQPEVIG